MNRKKFILRAVFLLWGTPAILAAGAQATESSQKSGPAKVLQLRELVREALERNPEIQGTRHIVEAKRARIPRTRAWPDPTLSASYAGNIVPPYTLMRGDPSSMRQFSAEQGIPYPGKTRLRGEIAAREADAENFVYEAVRRRVAAEVARAYFDLYFTGQGLSTIRKNRELLEKFEKIAEIRYSVGQAAQQDVLKAQVELSKLRERQTVLEQTRQTLEAQLNSLRDLPLDTPIGPTAEVRPSDLAYSLDELLAAARSNYPQIQRQRAVAEQNRVALDLARRDVRPDFSVGYTFAQRSGNGAMYGFTFSTSLPIFRRNKQDQAIREAAANLESARRMEASEFAVVRYQVKQEYLQVEAAAQLLKLYSQGIVPQSSLALESSLASYEVGKTDFLNVLSNFTTILDYELNYQQQLVNHEKALARLEELTGLTLIR